MSNSVHTTSDSDKDCKKRFNFVLFDGKPTKELLEMYVRITTFLDSKNINIINLETNKCYPLENEHEEQPVLKVKANSLLMRRLKNKGN